MLYLKDKSCVDCRISDPVVLDFDHRVLEEKKYNISQMMPSHNWSVIKEEIDKCDAVCANCHRKRTAKQFGWRKLSFSCDD